MPPPMPPFDLGWEQFWSALILSFSEQAGVALVIAFVGVAGFMLLKRLWRRLRAAI